MKVKVVASILTLLLLVSPLIMGYPEVYHGTVDINITGGCTETKVFTINNTMDKNLMCYIETTILPDGDGITISYVPSSPFFVSKHDTVDVEMTIEADMLLMPLSYTIDTTIYYKYADEAPKKSGPTCWSTDWKPDDNSEDDEEPTPDEGTNDGPNEPDAGDEQNEQKEEVKIEEPLIVETLLIVFGVIITSMVVLLYRKIKRKEK